jgi:nucleoid-associated protein YgaU
VGLLDFLKKKKEDAPASGGVTIKVGPRDTLKSLARKYYDDETVWTAIYDKNKWRIDGDELVVGQDCTLPAIPGKGPKENV